MFYDSACEQLLQVDTVHTSISNITLPCEKTSIAVGNILSSLPVLNALLVIKPVASNTVARPILITYIRIFLKVGEYKHGCS